MPFFFFTKIVDSYFVAASMLQQKNQLLKKYKIIIKFNFSGRKTNTWTEKYDLGRV